MDTQPDGGPYGDGTPHPITAFGGHNIVYEVHNYDPPSYWQQLFVAPAASLPVIIGELGPEDNDYGEQTFDDSVSLMKTAEQLQIPYAGWIFDENCNYSNDMLNMIAAVPGMSGCDPHFPVAATGAWGNAVMAELQASPAAPTGT